ncbi:MAG: hypothetical protein HYR66_08885 [Sphingobacteriales bacterium]|nr:hypothetical protein [Sphingobacteriales bacterium]MBI3718541.1 hypothetical protein [Sphingobacteriales bacterium]
MKKILLAFLIISSILPDSHAATVNINIVGFSFSPNNITVNVGDVININTNINHPTTQVSQATWDANGTTAISGALFMSQTTTITFTITAGMAGTNIYYVCENHVLSSGMKGQIVVNLATGLEENAKSEFNFTIYPNPVRNNSALNIILKKNDNVVMKIYSSDGKLASN